jgi:hypothetical protein
MKRPLELEALEARAVPASGMDQDLIHKPPPPPETGLLATEPQPKMAVFSSTIVVSGSGQLVLGPGASVIR